MTTRSVGTDETTGGGSLGGRRICIIGAGIGGLTAALAFACRGASVRVFEQASELTEVGAGIQISPNGARVLEALGLGDAMAASSLIAQAVVPVDAISGLTMTRFDLRTQSPPYRFFHRAGLIGLLAQAAQQAGVEISFGVKVLSVDLNGCLTTVGGRVECDLCIGADGIHSVSRAELGLASDATFRGQVAWRATVGMRGAPAQATIWMAPGRHVVTYPLHGDVMNIVAVQERSTWAEEGWNHPDDPANLQAAFSDTCPKLRELLSHVQQTRIWGLFRHEVAGTWFRDRLVILGDAAHPTLPFLAQGANLAIEDAWVLAACCDMSGLEAGLAQYQDRREGRVRKAIAAANANAKNYHLGGMRRKAAFVGLKVIGSVAPKAFLKRLDWLYGHDVTRA